MVPPYPLSRPMDPSPSITHSHRVSSKTTTHKAGQVLMPKTQLRNKRTIRNVAAEHRKKALNAVMHAIAVCNVVPFWQLPAIVYLYAVIVAESV